MLSSGRARLTRPLGCLRSARPYTEDSITAHLGDGERPPDGGPLPYRPIAYISSAIATRRSFWAMTQSFLAFVRSASAVRRSVRGVMSLA